LSDEVSHGRIAATGARRVVVITTDHEVQVAASPEEAFDKLLDMRNEVHWNPVTEEMSKTTDGPVGSGTRFDGKMKRVGPMHMVVTECDRPRSFTTEGGGRSASVSYSASFEPADGGTRIRTRMALDPKGVARVFAPLIARQVPKQEQEALGSFKRWIEGSR
jgi:carbon monoxide dehydrogenase subunit G